MSILYDRFFRVTIEFVPIDFNPKSACIIGKWLDINVMGSHHVTLDTVKPVYNDLVGYFSAFWS